MYVRVLFRMAPDTVASFAGWACMAAHLTSLSAHRRDHPPPFPSLCKCSPEAQTKTFIDTDGKPKKKKHKSNPNQVPTLAATHKCTSLIGVIPLPRAPLLSPLLWSMKPWLTHVLRSTQFDCSCRCPEDCKWPKK